MVTTLPAQFGTRPVGGLTLTASITGSLAQRGRETETETETIPPPCSLGLRALHAWAINPIWVDNSELL